MDGEVYIVLVIATDLRDGEFVKTVYAKEFTYDKRYVAYINI